MENKQITLIWGIGVLRWYGMGSEEGEGCKELGMGRKDKVDEQGGRNRAYWISGMEILRVIEMQELWWMGTVGR